MFPLHNDCINREELAFGACIFITVIFSSWFVPVKNKQWLCLPLLIRFCLHLILLKFSRLFLLYPGSPYMEYCFPSLNFYSICFFLGYMCFFYTAYCWIFLLVHYCNLWIEKMRHLILTLIMELSWLIHVMALIFCCLFSVPFCSTAHHTSWIYSARYVFFFFIVGFIVSF